VTEWPLQAVLLKLLTEDRTGEEAGGDTLLAFPAGRLLPLAPEQPDSVFLIVSGTIELLDGERILDRLEPGDRLTGGTFPGRVSIDVNLWKVPDWLPAAGERPNPTAALADDQVETRLGRPWVEAEGSTPAYEVARSMGERMASVAVVVDDGRLGVVTDADLRDRLVAGRQDPAAPIAGFASFPAVVVEVGETVRRARQLMTTRGVHHLPVVDQGRPVGMLAHLDAWDRDGSELDWWRWAISTAGDEAQLVDAGRSLRALMQQRVEAGVDVGVLSRMQASATDLLLERAIDLATAADGPLPEPFAWVALGSWGRIEQGLVFDQDHALVYDDANASMVGRYLEVAAGVEDLLRRAGIDVCPSRVMASKPGWHGTVQEWRQRLAAWFDIPEGKAAFLAATALDARRVTGSLDLTGLGSWAVGVASRHEAFLNRLARIAVDMRVPLGFLGNLVTTEQGEHPGLDVKRQGLLPIIVLARRYGLMAGIGSASTRTRLAVAADAGLLSTDSASALRDAHRLLKTMLVEHHARQIAAAVAPTDEIEVGELGRIERTALREAFAIVRAAQRGLNAELPSARWR
jgi:CBS domain-containing protein